MVQGTATSPLATDKNEKPMVITQIFRPMDAMQMENTKLILKYRICENMNMNCGYCSNTFITVKYLVLKIVEFFQGLL